MARTTLVESKIRAAHRLIEALEGRDFPITTAFWLYDEEAESWFLYLASPLARGRDTTELYGQVDEVREDVAREIGLSRIKVVDPSRKEIEDVADSARGRGTEYKPQNRKTQYETRWYSNLTTSSRLTSGDVLVYRST